jgi:hypothetical protein
MHTHTPENARLLNYGWGDIGRWGWKRYKGITHRIGWGMDSNVDRRGEGRWGMDSNVDRRGEGMGGRGGRERRVGGMQHR